MNDPSLAGQIKDLYRRRISDLFEADVVGSLAIEICHQDANAEFQFWGGFLEARRVLWRARARDSKQPPVLVLGWHPEEQLQALGGTWIDLLDWSGAAYLQYSHDDLVLKDTVGSILKGCKQSTPYTLLPTAADGLRLLGGISHWLERRLNISQGNLNIFRQAQVDKVPANTLEVFFPKNEAISEEHQAMLDNFSLVLRLLYNPAAGNDKTSPEVFQTKIEKFRAQWAGLENSKEPLLARAREHPGATVPLDDLIAATERVCKAFEDVIKHCKEVAEILEAQEKTGHDNRSID